MGNIPQHNIESVAAANDIVDVISSYFPLKRAGSSFKALCPFHQEKSPSFHVNPQRQTFHCFGCGVGGSVFRFVMNYEHLDFPTAVKKLGARAGVPVIEERGNVSEDDREPEIRNTLLQLHAEAAVWFHENLLKKEWAGPARDYLKKRGIDRRIAGDWQLGFAPDSWDSCLKWALDRGYRRGDILQSGLVKPRDEERPEADVYDRFRDRIMFPICNDVGEIIGFSGRILAQETETAKYLNSPETPLFRKGNVLFGLHRTKRALIDAKSAIVCEGQLDLITLFEAGIANVVAPQGTAFTEKQARILKRFVGEVILCFDADIAGHKAAERSLDALLQNDLIVRVIELPAGEDPDSLVRRDGSSAFQKRVDDARDFFEAWIDYESSATDLNSLGAKMKLARQLADTVGRVRDPLMRSEVSSKVSARLGIPLQEFQRLLASPANRDRFGAVEDTTAPQLAPPRHDIATLCLLALRDADARDFLLAQNWREVLSQTAGADILLRILEADLRPDDVASVSTFMAGLTPAEESFVAGWLVQKAPPNPAVVARDWWMGLRQASVRRQLQIAEGRIRIPQLSGGEVVNLQKQILDLKEQLNELAKFSSARALDD